MTEVIPSHPVLTRSSRLEAFDRYPDIALLHDGSLARWAFVTTGGVEILGLCDGARSVADIANTVATAKHVPYDAVYQQTERFLGVMVDTGLVHDRGEQPAEIARPQTCFEGLTIEITRRCNLRCRHCYLAAGEANPDELTCAEIIDLISQARDLGATFANLSGGEPLLHQNCFTLLEHIAATGLLSIIGTNATLITADVASRLADLPVFVQVSLDGISSETHDAMRGPGAFGRTMLGMDHLLRVGMAERVSLAFTATAGNVQDAAGLIELALAEGLRGVVFTSLLAGGNASDHSDELKLSSTQAFAYWDLISAAAGDLAGQLSILHQGIYMSLAEPGVSKVLCSIGTNLRVDSEGNVYPCQCFVGGLDYRLGNLRQQPLAQMVHGTRLQEIKRSRYERIEMIDRCRECDWRHYCGAGCMGQAYHKQGTILATPDCDIRHRWVRRLFEQQLTRCVEITPGFKVDTG